jgi:hypothetical protein
MLSPVLLDLLDAAGFFLDQMVGWRAASIEAGIAEQVLGT